MSRLAKMLSVLKDWVRRSFEGVESGVGFVQNGSALMEGLAMGLSKRLMVQVQSHLEEKWLSC